MDIMNIINIASRALKAADLLVNVIAQTDEQRAAAHKFVEFANTITGAAVHGIEFDAGLAEKIDQITAVLDQLDAAGEDLTQVHFTSLGDYVRESESALQAIIRARREAAQSVD